MGQCSDCSTNLTKCFDVWLGDSSRHAAFQKLHRRLIYLAIIPIAEAAGVGEPAQFLCFRID